MERKPRRRGRGDDGLTPRQRELLAALEAAIARTGYAPSVRELCAALGLRSTATVHSHLRQLERAGRIRRASHQARAIEVLSRPLPEREGVRSVPVLGRVPAGAPLTAYEEADGALPVPDLVPERRLFALRVRGDSMVGAGILDGDYVLVEPREDVEPGSVVVALLGEEATVKRLTVRPDGPWLVAENPAYPPIGAREARILGRVVALYRPV
jgi:repressor LexA